MTIHWVGTGLSAIPGLRRLLAGDTPVAVWNRTVDKAREAVGDLTGDIRAYSLPALTGAVAAGDVVVSMLPADQHPALARMCVEKRAHFVSSSYISPEMAAMDARARDAGVAFSTPPAADGPSTARCYVLVTPDGERTMNTYLGAAQDLHPADVDAEMIAASAITYLEGYLWDPPHAKEAFRKAAKIAHEAGRQVALTLSDAFCVDRYRAEFLELIKAGTVDLVFANERELISLYQTADFDTAAKALRGDAKLAVVTRSEKGCVVISKSDMVSVPAAPIRKMVDATGAGDLFAAGFLVGLSRGRDHKTAGQLGAIAAAEVIQHIGARPEVSLKELAQQSGLKL